MRIDEGKQCSVPNFLLGLGEGKDRQNNNVHCKLYTLKEEEEEKGEEGSFGAMYIIRLTLQTYINIVQIKKRRGMEVSSENWIFSWVN